MRPSSGVCHSNAERAGAVFDVVDLEEVEVVGDEAAYPRRNVKRQNV